MKVFVATSRGQGVRPNDFCFTTEGELVSFPVVECDDDPDGPCGCRRALGGVESSRGTTTFTVVDRPDLDLETYAWALGASMAKDGWAVEPDDAETLAEAEELASLADAFSVGDLLERRDEIGARSAS